MILHISSRGRYLLITYIWITYFHMNRLKFNAVHAWVDTYCVKIRNWLMYVVKTYEMPLSDHQIEHRMAVWFFYDLFVITRVGLEMKMDGAVVLIKILSTCLSLIKLCLNHTTKILVETTENACLQWTAKKLSRYPILFYSAKKNNC